MSLGLRLDPFLGIAYRGRMARLVQGSVLTRDSDTQHVMAVV